MAATVILRTVIVASLSIRAAANVRPYSQKATDLTSMLSRTLASAKLGSWNAVCGQRQVTEWSLSWNLNSSASSRVMFEKYHQRMPGEWLKIEAASILSSPSTGAVSASPSGNSSTMNSVFDFSSPPKLVRPSHTASGTSCGGGENARQYELTRKRLNPGPSGKCLLYVYSAMRRAVEVLVS